MTETPSLIARLVDGTPHAADEILARAADSTQPTLLVAAAVVCGDASMLARAARHAVTTQDRQLVALAITRQAGDRDLLDLLVHDHLTEHPDSPLAAWIAGYPAHPA